MADAAMDRTAAPKGAVATFIEWWALAGGIILCAVVVINTASVVGTLFGMPVPGDFELTEMGVAVAAFSFLPYCQLTRSNVTADIFTSRLSARWISAFTLIAALIALCFAAILLWRMYAGMLDQRAYDYTTTILQVPHWWAYLPILLSLALLCIAALITMREEWRGH